MDATSGSPILPATLFPAGPPTLQLEPRPGTLDPEAVLALARALRPDGAPLPSERMRLLEGIALLWNDCWDQAHEIAQSREGARDFDTLHAMLHRREGDYPNSGYWFRTAGTHPCYLALAERIAPWLDRETKEALLPLGRWSPSAFVDRVRKRSKGPDGAEQTLMRVQAEEFRAFAEWVLKT